MRQFYFSAALFVLTTYGVCAHEQITLFSSDVTVQEDASLDVFESIDVIAEGAAINHGILRDFPTQYKDRNGLAVNIGFQVLGVSRDGEDEPYTVENISRGKRIRIGKGDVTVRQGAHNYTIHYRTTRQLGFFDSYDELYWNVTGNGWTFPIMKADVKITLPPEARITSASAYTGAQGANGNSFKVLSQDDNVYHARTIRYLNPGEGFTVAVGWPKGIVAAPTESDKRAQTTRDNAGLVLLFAGLAAVLGYYVWVWNKVGRDPRKGQIIPLFAPPKGFDAASTRYLWKKGFDDQTFAAGLIGLAAKGFLDIKLSGDEYTVLATGKATDASLSPAETQLISKIGASPLALSQDNQTRISTLKDTIKSTLQKAQEGVYFHKNSGWVWLGALASIALLFAAAVLLPGDEAQIGLFIAFWCAIWWAVTLGLVASRLKALRRAHGIIGKFGAGLSLLFAVPLLVGCLSPLVILNSMKASLPLYAMMGAGAVLAGLNLVFYYLLFAPTETGQKLMDEIEGFRLYLATAETDRLNILNPPEKTPALFERYLPYAMALDCENEWNEKFVSVLAAAAAAGQATMLWYNGYNSSFTNFSDFNNSVASSMVAPSTGPGLSSGSFGGGFSGGGGGGGGGSGW